MRWRAWCGFSHHGVKSRTLNGVAVYLVPFMVVSPVNLLFFAPLRRELSRGSSRTRNSCELCTTHTLILGTSVSYVRPSHNTRGRGTTVLYLPRTFSEFFALATMAETFVGSVRLQYPYPKLLQVF